MNVALYFLIVSRLATCFHTIIMTCIRRNNRIMCHYIKFTTSEIAKMQRPRKQENRRRRRQQATPSATTSAVTVGRVEATITGDNEAVAIATTSWCLVVGRSGAESSVRRCGAIILWFHLSVSRPTYHPYTYNSAVLAT